MAIPQQKFRELVFQLLYSYDIGSSKEDLMIPFMMEELSVSKKTVLQAQERVGKIQENLKEIDTLIANASKSYAFDRIQTVEKNILRLGVFELLHDPSIPPKVALAEAIRLTRKFGTPESGTFVNAILDSILHSSK
jgi:N utilization substance protein B